MEYLKNSSVLNKMGEGFQILKPLDYLKIDIINNHGEDKLTWDERIKLFDDYNKNDNLDALLEGADKPSIVYGGIQTFHKVMKGEPTGFTVGLDATSSGIQWLSVLSGDRQAAELTNVVNTGSRRDAYHILYQYMLSKLDNQEEVITRAEVKDAIITSIYGSKAVPKSYFGEGDLLYTFYDTLIESIPAAWDLNELLVNLWNSEALTYDWVQADMFTCHMRVENTITERSMFKNKPIEYSYKIYSPKDEGRGLAANTVHSYDAYALAELVRRVCYDPHTITYLSMLVTGSFGKDFNTRDDRPKDRYALKLWDYFKETGVISAKIFDYIDDDNLGLFDTDVIYDLLSLIPPKPFQMINIHDEFKALPTYMNYVRAMYTHLLYEQAKGDTLSKTVSSITKRKIKINKKDNTLYKDILNSNYALS